MKFKIDENLPVELKALLNNEGHDAVTVLDENLGGRDDPDIVIACQQEDRVLVTLDLDFSDIRTYPPGENRGIIVFRLHRQDKSHVLGIAQGIVPVLETELVDKHLWVVEERRIRIRG